MAERACPVPGTGTWLGATGGGYIGRVRSRPALSNWLWLALVAALIGIVVWGWVYDFTVR